MALKHLLCAAALVMGVVSARSVVDTNSVTADEARSDAGDTWLGDLRAAYRVYSECNGGASDLSSCLKVKLVSALDRAARSAADLQVAEGVALVKDPVATQQQQQQQSQQPKTEQQLEAELPRALAAKDETLDAMIVDKALGFLQTHTLQLKFPTSELGAEARKKKNSGLLLLPLLMGAMLIPVALGGLALLAGKALLVSKLALVLAGVIGLKKLLSSSHGGHDSSYQVVSVPSHGHHGRSLDLAAAQGLAYRAHVPSPSS